MMLHQCAGNNQLINDEMISCAVLVTYSAYQQCVGYVHFYVDTHASCINEYEIFLALGLLIIDIIMKKLQ